MPRSSRQRPLVGACPFALPVEDYADNLLVGTTLARLDPGVIDRVEHVDLVRRWVTQGLPRTPSRKKSKARFDWKEAAERVLRARLRDKHAPIPEVREPAEPVASNLREVSRSLHLNADEHRLLSFLLALHVNGELGEFCGVFGQLSTRQAIELIAVATAIPLASVDAALDTSGRLLGSGVILSLDADRHSLEDKVKLNDEVREVVQFRSLGPNGLAELLLPKAPLSTLHISDYAHLSTEFTTLQAVLRAALNARRPGVNVLLYGPTGTGKTEMARLLADSLGTGLFIAGLRERYGRLPDEEDRVASLQLGHRLLSPGEGILLFDEVEDVFEHGALSALFGKGHRGSRLTKQTLNDLLEANPIPTIWISNETDLIDPAHLRRFSYVVEFQNPGPRTRARVLARHMETNADLSPAEIESVARRYTVSPAQLSTAVRTARLEAPDGRARREQVERILAPIEKVMTGSDPSRRVHFDPETYRIEVVNASVNVDDLAEKLSGWTPTNGPGLSLCLYGPPGTGKSELVHYLAYRMGRPVLAKRGSDLFGPFVGETEKSIARAFAEAEADDAVLLFDEVDSFLRDRRTAQRSWEVSAVNEFLRSLETCRGVVACTTNLWTEIDPAALRRFIFKIEFGWMRPEQVPRMFEAAFGTAATPPAMTLLRGAKNLAPGDFAAVARQLRAIGGGLDSEPLAQRVLAEAQAKGEVRREVGFRRR